MLRYLKEAGYSLLSIVKGLGVTAANARRKPVTILYPEVRPNLAPRFRGLPEVDMDLCIVCKMCEKVCPTQCILIVEKPRPAVTEEADPDAPKVARKKEASVFDINAGLCMFCGMCEEACPTKPVKAIALHHNFEVAKASRDELVYGIEDDHVLAPANPPKGRGK